MFCTAKLMFFLMLISKKNFVLLKRSILSAPTLVKKHICCLSNNVFLSCSVHIAVVEIKPLFVVRILTESCVMAGA